MSFNREGKVSPAGRTGPWWLIAFDLLLGGLFLSGSVTGFQSLRTRDPGASEGSHLVSLFASSFDVCLAAILILSGALLLRRSRWAGVFQRAVFWALLLRCVFVVMEISLPSQGGVGGLVLVAGLLVLVPLTAVALAGAIAASGGSMP